MTLWSPAPAHPPAMTLQTEEAPRASVPCQPGLPGCTHPQPKDGSFAVQIPGQDLGRVGCQQGHAGRPLPVLLPEDFRTGYTGHEDRNQSCLVPMFVG